MNLNKIRVLLADDHVIVQDGLECFLEHEEDIEILGSASTGLEVLEMIKQKCPQVIVMDISMPGLNGIETTRKVLEENPHIKIIILSVHSDRKFVDEALKAGAVGYLPKESMGAELRDAVHSVMEGKTFLSPSITKNFIDSYLYQDPTDKGEVKGTGLTNREREVLQLVAEGHATKSIAAELGMQVRTAETHRRNIMEKLNIHSVAELTKFAVRNGLTALE